jgi:hypothetical protein
MNREWQTEIEQDGQWQKVGGLCSGTLGCVHMVKRNSLEGYPMRARNVRTGEIHDRSRILCIAPVAV